jgi:peptidoglycan/LPS O-acetylase OafA/YrhL
MSSNLDLVRASAVLCVFFAHLYQKALHVVDETAWHFGQLGVTIFFVHTSLVLMQSLERTDARIGEFYTRRAFRIYPLSIVVVTIAFLLQMQPWTWQEYLANLTLTFNLFYMEGMSPSLWTLPIEVQMYLLLPFLFWFVRSRPVWYLIPVWLAAVAIGVVQPHISARLNVLEFAPCFIAGVISWRLSKVVDKRLSWWPLAFLATWPIFLIATRQYDDQFRWAYALVLGLVIPWFKDRKWPLVGTIAKYSYGIYLTHVAIIEGVFSLPGPAWMKLLVVFAAVAVTAFILFHVIEDPMIQRAKTLWTDRRHGALDSLNESLQ